MGTWVPSTYVGGVGLRLSSLGVWPSGSFPKLQLTGVGVFERGSEEAGGAHRGDEESAGAGEGWVSAPAARGSLRGGMAVPVEWRQGLYL